MWFSRRKCKENHQQITMEHDLMNFFRCQTKDKKIFECKVNVRRDGKRIKKHIENGEYE